MNKGLIRLIVGTLLLTAAAPALLWAQGAAPPTAAPQAPPPGAAPPQVMPAYSQAELDQLLAPVALYPDTLVGQILMASTYPLEVVAAYRWTQEPANARLQGDQLAAAIQDKDWDPSVKSLIPFPQVLRMMNDRLDWTQRLGNAFLAQEADVMDSVQRLRRAAEEAGSLKSSSQQVVTTTADQAIVIAPPESAVVYVPVYDPTVVYGVWPYPAYPPYYYWPPGFIYAEPYWPGFWWWPAIQIGFWGAYWGWGNFDWHNHYIYVDHNRYDRIAGHRPPFSGNTWHHDSYHRRGVAYRDPGTAARYGRPVAPPGARGSYRGYDRTPAAAPPAARPGAPSTRQPVTRQPSGAPSTRQPVTRPPSGAPPTRQPVTKQPSGTPSTRQPVTRPPSGAPTTRQPVTRQPSTTPSTRQPITRQVPPVQRGGTTVQPRTPPAFGGYGQGSDVRTQSQRGRSSLQSSPPRSSTPAMSAPRPSSGARPSSQPSRSGGGGGGQPSGGGGGGRGSGGSAPRR